MLFFLNGKRQMANEKCFSVKRTNRFERFAIFRPPALPGFAGGI
jgi:hypothetical protein